MQSELPTRPMKELDIRQPGLALASLEPTLFELERDLTIVLDTTDRHDRRIAEAIAASLAG